MKYYGLKICYVKLPLNSKNVEFFCSQKDPIFQYRNAKIAL